MRPRELFPNQDIGKYRVSDVWLVVEIRGWAPSDVHRLQAILLRNTETDGTHSRDGVGDDVIDFAERSEPCGVSGSHANIKQLAWLKINSDSRIQTCI